MGTTKPSWKHPKYKGLYRGSYERDKKGERVFVLSCEKPVRNVTFESCQAAKALGWKRG